MQRFVEIEREERGKAALHAEVAELGAKLRAAKAKLRAKPTEAPPVPAPALKAPVPKAEASNLLTNQAAVRASGPA